MSMDKTQDTSHIRFPTASVVLHKPHVRTSEMPVTASSKRRQAVPALRSARPGLLAGEGTATDQSAVEVAATAATVSTNSVICVFVALKTPEEDRSHQ